MLHLVFERAHGNEHRQTSTFNRSNGTVGATADVWFKSDATYSVAQHWLTVPSDVSKLPDLTGMGTVYDLHQAIVRDTTGALKKLVESFVAESEPVSRTAVLEQIIFRWTGADMVDPYSRGPSIDARRLAALEKFVATPFAQAAPGDEASALLMQSYDGVFERLYADLAQQTNVNLFYRLIDHWWDAGSSSLKGAMPAVQTELQAQLTADPTVGKRNLSEFARSVKGFLAETTLGYSEFRDHFVALSPEYARVMDENLMVGNEHAERVYGYSTPDKILARGGNDTVHANAGDDIIDGGKGYDALYGGDGTDTYVFNSGWGRDAVYQDDAAADALDVVQFGPGILAADIAVYRPTNIANQSPYPDAPFDYYGTDIVLVHEKTGEWVRIAGALREEAGPNGTWIVPDRVNVDEVRFADGTVWTHAQVMQKAFAGHAWGENIDGLYGDDVLDGLGGDDRIRGRSGDDTIAGGIGNDDLTGEQGNDILEGGSGNDVLNGGPGSDIYRLNAGFGYDTIYQDDADPLRNDVIEFGAGILAAGVVVRQVAQSHVELSINGTGDRLRLDNFLSPYTTDADAARFRFNQVKFADGTTWDSATIKMVRLQ